MLGIPTFATRNELDVGCFLRFLRDKERGICEESELDVPFEKNFKINLA